MHHSCGTSALGNTNVFVPRLLRRRAAAARKIQAAARARQARLLEAFIESLVFFPELGDIAFYNW